MGWFIFAILLSILIEVLIAFFAVPLVDQIWLRVVLLAIVPIGFLIAVLLDRED